MSKKMESRIFEGKTSTEAIEKGLKELKLSKKDVEIKILEEEKRSFFSILTPRVVKVELIPIEHKNEKKEVIAKSEKRVEKEIEKLDNETLKNAKVNVDNFLEKFIPQLKIENLKYEVKENNPFIEVNIDAEDVNHLIGHRGDTLNELQNILTGIAGNGIEKRVRVILDISNYKQKREKNLEELAEKISKTVIRNKKNITLEPMNAYERKIIHTKLQNHPKVTTKSIGEEPYRKIVVCLKK